MHYLLHNSIIPKISFPIRLDASFFGIFFPEIYDRYGDRLVNLNFSATDFPPHVTLDNN